MPRTPPRANDPRGSLFRWARRSPQASIAFASPLFRVQGKRFKAFGRRSVLKKPAQAPRDDSSHGDIVFLLRLEPRLSALLLPVPVPYTTSLGTPDGSCSCHSHYVSQHPHIHVVFKPCTGPAFETIRFDLQMLSGLPSKYRAMAKDLSKHVGPPKGSDTTQLALLQKGLIPTGSGWSPAGGGWEKQPANWGLSIPCGLKHNAEGAPPHPACCAPLQTCKRRNGKPLPPSPLSCWMSHIRHGRLSSPCPERLSDIDVALYMSHFHPPLPYKKSRMSSLQRFLPCFF